MTVGTFRKRSIIVAVDEYQNGVVVAKFIKENPEAIGELASVIGQVLPSATIEALADRILIYLAEGEEFRRYAMVIRNCIAQVFGTEPYYTTLATHRRLREFREHNDS